MRVKGQNPRSMNVTVHRRNRLYLLLLLLLPLWGYGQDVVQDTIYESQGYSLVSTQLIFTSEPNAPSFVAQPVHGTATWEEISPFTYELTYTRTDGQMGTDNFTLMVWEKLPNINVFQPKQLSFHIVVNASSVKAVHDHATTYIDQAISIDVLANDLTTSGVIFLKNVPLANHGSASFTDPYGNLLFTPSPGFEGTAYLNYVACDSTGACDNGTVVVSVVNPDLSAADTLKIFTRKNQEQPVFVPHEYVLVQAPAHGSFDQGGYVSMYAPDTDYVGTDYILFEYMGEEKVVLIEVLDLVKNLFAVDDELYITPYDGETEINVLLNDKYGITSSCVSLQTQPQYGTATYNPQADGRGLMRYTPPAGFTGVDWFTYSACPPGGTGSQSETATVYVFVSNYQPSTTNFEMSTPKLTPLVVGYSVPIEAYTFEVIVGGDLGTTEFLAGQVDTVIMGQPISGYNLILYTPNDDVDSGVDDIELKYCVDLNGNCMYERTVKIDIEILDIGDGSGPMCFYDCIWSGDTNFDGEVNMEDLLPIGLAMGEVGIPRDEVNFDIWYGQYGSDWQDPFQVLPIDLKHIDADGDSIITAADTVAISTFYGKAHSMTATPIPFYEDEILLEGPLFVSPGDLVELEMILGQPGDPAKNIYGFTFPFSYNPDMVVPESVEIDFETNSWLAYNSPILYMQRNDLAGKVESGFTRTNAISADGHGRIGAVRFVITDDLEGFRPDKGDLLLPLGGGDSKVMNGGGMSYAVRVGGTTLRIRLEEDLAEQPLDEDQLKLYPNPTSRDFINVHLNGGQEMERVVVHDLAGRRIYDTDRILSRRTQLSVGHLPNGMYILTAFTEKGVINKKFQVLR